MAFYTTWLKLLDLFSPCVKVFEQLQRQPGLGQLCSKTLLCTPESKMLIRIASTTTIYILMSSSLSGLRISFPVPRKSCSFIDFSAWDVVQDFAFTARTSTWSATYPTVSTDWTSLRMPRRNWIISFIWATHTLLFSAQEGTQCQFLRPQSISISRHMLMSLTCLKGKEIEIIEIIEISQTSPGPTESNQTRNSGKISRWLVCI